MTLNQAEKRHSELAQIIREYDKAYASGHQTITDKEYDRLYQEIADLESSLSELVTPDSPTQKVWQEHSEGFNRVRHSLPMLSLEKIRASDQPTEQEVPDPELRKREQDQNTIQGLRSFDRTVSKQLGGKSVSYVIEPKVD